MNADLKRANEFYKTAHECGGLCEALRESRLKEAIRIYQTEMTHSTNQDFRISIMRNHGMASLRIAELYQPKSNLSIIIYHLAEAIKSLTNVLAARPAAINTGWGEKTQEKIVDCFGRGFRSVIGPVGSQRIPKFHCFKALFDAIAPQKEVNFVRVQFLLARCQYYYQSGSKAMEESDFKSTLQLVEYCHEDIELALKYAAGDEVMLLDIERLKEDNSFLRCTCESVRTRYQADELFDTYVNQSEEVNFEMMWDVLDMYKEAALKTRERDIENEAFAICRQGRIFHKIFKVNSKAHTYYRRAFDLAQCLFPRDLNKVDWFIECKKVLQTFQQEILRAEKEKADKEKAPILKKLAPELAEIKKIHEQHDPFKLLKHVYEKHPPKLTYEFDYSKLNSETIKKAVMKTITYYHPDRQSAFGIEWKVLCEEITKYLTVHYERLK